MTAYYFGPIGRAGHCLWDSALRSVVPGWPPPAEIPWRQIDGPLLPDTDRRQGSAYLHHLGGWTALDIHDFTVDHRGGSHALFLFDEDYDLDEVTRWIKKTFPSVFARIAFAGPIYLART